MPWPEFEKILIQGKGDSFPKSGFSDIRFETDLENFFLIMILILDYEKLKFFAG